METSWKEPTTDFLQTLLALIELVAARKKLVLALKEVVESVWSKDDNLSKSRSDGFSHGPVLKVAQKEEEERTIQDIYLYGAVEKRIQAVVGAALEEAVPNGIPRIIVNGASTNTTVYGLRTILDAKYQALHAPPAVLVTLENFSEDMMLKFQRSDFREKLQKRGVRVAVVAWSCIPRGQPMEQGLLTTFGTKLFVPSSADEEAWMGEQGSFKKEASASTQSSECINHGVDEEQGIAETELTTGTVPGPSKAEPVFLSNDSSNGSPSSSQSESNMYPQVPLPSSIGNKVEQIQKPIFHQPRAPAFKPDAQTVTDSSSMLKVEQSKQLELEMEPFEDDEIGNRRKLCIFCKCLADSCFNCLVGCLVCVC